MAHLNSIIVFGLMITTWQGVRAAEWEGFLGKFTASIFGNKGFWDLPLTKTDAINSDPPYIDTKVQDPEFQVDIFCLKNDPHVCILFDKNGRVAGLRISHLKSEVASDLSKFPYKYDEISLFNTSTLMGVEAWYTNFLFTKPENIRPGGHGRMNIQETADGLWVRLPNGWTEIPRDECDAQNQGFQKQGFIRWMGTHYSWGQLKDCTTFMPLLPIYNKGRLIALSFAPLGKHTVVERDWFEDVPADVVSDIVPNGYQYCLQKWTENYGVSSFHFYFIKHPRFILFNRGKEC